MRGAVLDCLISISKAGVSGLLDSLGLAVTKGSFLELQFLLRLKHFQSFTIKNIWTSI